jgi:GABA permease
VIGFLCVIMAAVSPNTVFLFLLNSIGAVILFVYLMICVSQIALRMRTPKDQLKVKMWLFPVLSLLTTAAVLAILVQMAVDASVRSQFLLSLLSWGVILVMYAITKWRGGSVPIDSVTTLHSGKATRVLVLANETVDAAELIAELGRIDHEQKATYLVCVPANPVDLGQAEHTGPLNMWDATKAAAERRLAHMLDVLDGNGLDAAGELGDYRPLRALANAVATFNPDQLVISTLPAEDSTWLRYDVVDRARTTYPMPVLHVVSARVAPELVPQA